MYSDDWYISNKIAFRWIPEEFTGDKSTIRSSENGLVISGNKPLPESMLTQI